MRIACGLAREVQSLDKSWTLIKHGRDVPHKEAAHEGGNVDFKNLAQKLGSSVEAWWLMQEAQIWNPESLRHEDWVSLAREILRRKERSDHATSIDLPYYVLVFLCSTAKAVEQIEAVLIGDFPIDRKMKEGLLDRLRSLVLTFKDWYGVWVLTDPLTEFGQYVLSEMVRLSSGLLSTNPKDHALGRG
ncbi:MAG: hypothetical protein AUJ19_03430 [Parcubacteria group bacterium CG1_02_58_44]|nr:MAG: hypothetical protein AUJ19_03430 [Parcubacteria group bacterium CG1_02_58_44]